MKTTIQDHPALQMLILAIATVTVLYVAAGFVDVLTVVNAADAVRLLAGKRAP